MTTGEGSDVEGNNNGIRARNFGYGSLEVTANGDVTGTTQDGIFAFNSANGEDLTVTTSEIGD